jgi:hypothetical protein
MILLGHGLIGSLFRLQCLFIWACTVSYTHPVLQHTDTSIQFIPDPGSNFFPSRIPDPGSELSHPGSRIRIKEFKYFNPKKWFLNSRKYDPGCSSRIRMLTSTQNWIPDPGVKKAPDPGSGSATLPVPVRKKT